MADHIRFNTASVTHSESMGDGAQYVCHSACFAPWFNTSTIAAPLAAVSAKLGVTETDTVAAGVAEVEGVRLNALIADGRGAAAGGCAVAAGFAHSL
jgi:hypothetical protein